jgi:carbon monoxide dehydrogenase subunit G
VPVCPQQAWPLLIDVSNVAFCVPGARVLEVTSDGLYRGELAVKLGPVAMTFSGEMHFEALDAAAGTAVAFARARELRNRGSADARLHFQLHTDEGGTRVDVLTDLTLAGQAAQYGRASGVLSKVSALLLSRFAACLARRIEQASAL